jgi:proton-translocating NADH-quinone oxidoreductase chain N
MQANTAFFWLIAGLFIASPLVYFVGRVGMRLLNGQINAARWVTIGVLILAWIPLFFAGLAMLQGELVQIQLGQMSLEMDGMGLFLAVTVMMLVTLVGIYSIHYIGGEPDEEKYYAMLLAMTASMIGLGCARDLFNLWVWFEAMAVTSYLLVVFYRNQPGALEAGVKYILQSAVGSLLVLMGIALVFAQAGTLDLVAMRPALENGGLLAVAAGGLFIIGFGVKGALVPLHTWLPDAHSQAPSGVSALLSGLVIECGLVAMLRAIGGLAGASPAWGPLLLAFGVLNMLVGNLMALRQKEVKRLLAYSSVAQVGYMLVGFGIAAAYGIFDGAAGGFFHLFNHAVMKGLAFLAAGVLLVALHIANGSHAALTLDDLNGAAKKYPLSAFALSVAVLALGGLPPLSGFVSKWQIMVAGATVRSTPILWLVIFTGLNSVLSLGYYAPLVNRLYRREPSAAVLAGKPVAALMALPLIVLILLAVVPGLWPPAITWLTGPAAASLLRGFGY